MIYEPPNPMLIFIVDTNKYAGNFERAMIAYMTGMYGECGVGKEQAIIFYKEMGLLKKDIDYREECLPSPEDFGNPFSNMIASLPDDRGCCRPSSIWENPRWFNDGNGNHYKEGVELKRPIKRKWPAYNSVATFFNEFPSKELLDIMIERAKNFVPYIKTHQFFPVKNLEIELFRLIERKQVDRDLCFLLPQF